MWALETTLGCGVAGLERNVGKSDSADAKSRSPAKGDRLSIYNLPRGCHHVNQKETSADKEASATMAQSGLATADAPCAADSPTRGAGTSTRRGISPGTGAAVAGSDTWGEPGPEGGD